MIRLTSQGKVKTPKGLKVHNKFDIKKKLRQEAPTL